MPIPTRQARRSRIPAARGRSAWAPGPTMPSASPLRSKVRVAGLSGELPPPQSSPSTGAGSSGRTPYSRPSGQLQTGLLPGRHPLTDVEANGRLHDYESGVRGSFDRIVPVLKEIASHRCEPDFTARAQAIARAELRMSLPDHLLDDAWVTGLDMRRLFAWVLFETYRRIGDEFFSADPLGGREGGSFHQFLLGCGFHLLDVTPCADGRLAHAVSFVLRLPYGSVRRKSYAGALFDIENSVEKWVETELRRFREGVPNTADAPTRYLKVVLYHFSSGDPSHQGCAAHGSDDAAAARAGWERLRGFRQAVENGFCCGASVDLLLMGVDTDSDALRVHVPDAEGHCDLAHWLDVAKVYETTSGMSPSQGRERIAELVRDHAPAGAAGSPGGPAEGMVNLIARLIENNISQIDYVRSYHSGRYQDIGHAERFIGAGIGFEEIQLRNLTYFAYLDTVEEGAADLDVGIRIFSGLNVAHGLPVPVVVRYDYHGGVPGARARAVAHCERISKALAFRYPKLHADGLLHCLRVVRDCDSGAPMEIVGSSLDPAGQAAH